MKEFQIKKQALFVSDEEFCINTINLLNDDNLWTRMNKELKKKKIILWIEIAKKWQKILN